MSPVHLEVASTVSSSILVNAAASLCALWGQRPHKQKLRVIAVVPQENTPTRTQRHRHTITHLLMTGLSLVPFRFADSGLSALPYFLLVILSACRIYPAPFHVAEQHVLRDTSTISLASAVSKRSPTFPHPASNTSASPGQHTILYTI